MRSIPSLKGFPHNCLSNGSYVALIDAGLFASPQGRWWSASSFDAFLLQAIDGMMPLAEK